MAGGVFISYRREDSAGFAGRIYDRLVSRLESSRVFFDVDNIEPGLDFVKVLADRVGDCDALVAIIGEEWLSVRDEEQKRRLDDPHDFVRIEIEAALHRDIRVIPVLINGARMPRAADLPDPLKGLARRQAIEISHTRFDTDSERLARALQRALDAPRTPPPDADPKNPASTHEAQVASVALPTQARSAADEAHPLTTPPVALFSSAPEPGATAIDGGNASVVQPRSKADAKSFPVKALASAAVVAIVFLSFAYLRMTANHEPPLKPVFAAGQLAVSEALSFSGPEGGPFSPSQAVFNLKASGAGFDWAIDSLLPAWFEVAPMKGHIVDDGTMDVTVTLVPFFASSLSPGQYEGQIIFKNLTSGLTVTRTERLTVTEGQKIAPGQLMVGEAPDFSGPEGGPFSPSQAIFNLKANGAGFDWAIDNTLPVWLVATPAKGHLSDNGDMDVILTLTPGAELLGPDHYQGQIVFKNLASGLAVTRTENLTVSPRPPPADELKEVVKPPLPVTFGDTYEKVKAAYKISQAPEPFISSVTKKQDGTMLQLKQLGIFFFFDASGKISTIRFDAPFAGTVSGIKIGDTRTTVEKILGKPEPSDDTTSVFYPKYPHELWYDLMNNAVTTIFL